MHRGGRHSTSHVLFLYHETSSVMRKTHFNLVSHGSMSAYRRVHEEKYSTEMTRSEVPTVSVDYANFPTSSATVTCIKTLDLTPVDVGKSQSKP